MLLEPLCTAHTCTSPQAVALFKSYTLPVPPRPSPKLRRASAIAAFRGDRAHEFLWGGTSRARASDSVRSVFNIKMQTGSRLVSVCFCLAAALLPLLPPCGSLLFGNFRVVPNLTCRSAATFHSSASRTHWLGMPPASPQPAGDQLYHHYRITTSTTTTRTRTRLPPCAL